MAKYNMTPVELSQVETEYISSKTKLPVQDSLEISKTFKASETQSMMSQLPTVWHRA